MQRAARLSLLTTLCLLCVLSADAQRTSVEISGVVTDLKDDIVPRVQLLFLGSAGHKSVLTNSNGKYGAQLEPDVYDVYMKIGVDIWAAKRSRIDLRDGATTNLNFYMLPECVSYGCDHLGFDFDVFRLATDPLDLVIGFADSKRSKGTTTYGGAILTYGTTTIWAKQVIRNQRSGMTLAKDGWIEVGSLRKSFSELQVETGGRLLNAPDSITRLKSGSYSHSLAKLDRYFDAK